MSFVLVGIPFDFIALLDGLSQGFSSRRPLLQLKDRLLSGFPFQLSERLFFDADGKRPASWPFVQHPVPRERTPPVPRLPPARLRQRPRASETGLLF